MKTKKKYKGCFAVAIGSDYDECGYRNIGILDIDNPINSKLANVREFNLKDKEKEQQEIAYQIGYNILEMMKFNVE